MFICRKTKNFCHSIYLVNHYQTSFSVFYAKDFCRSQFKLSFRFNMKFQFCVWIFTLVFAKVCSKDACKNCLIKYRSKTLCATECAKPQNVPDHPQIPKPEIIPPKISNDSNSVLNTTSDSHMSADSAPPSDSTSKSRDPPVGSNENSNLPRSREFDSTSKNPIIPNVPKLPFNPDFADEIDEVTSSESSIPKSKNSGLDNAPDTSTEFESKSPLPDPKSETPNDPFIPDSNSTVNYNDSNLLPSDEVSYKESDDEVDSISIVTTPPTDSFSIDLPKCVAFVNIEFLSQVPVSV